MSMISPIQALEQPTHSYTIYSSTLHLKPDSFCEKPVFKVARLPISEAPSDNPPDIALLPPHIWEKIIAYLGEKKLNMRLVCQAFARPQLNPLYRDSSICLDREIFNVCRAYPGIPFSNTSLKTTEAGLNGMKTILERFPHLRSFSSLMIMKPKALQELMSNEQYKPLYPILTTLVFFWLNKKLDRSLLQDFLRKAPCLSELRLSRTDEVSGLFTVFKNGELPALRSISLMSTAVTSLDIIELLSVASHLRELHIPDCKEIDFQALGTHLETLSHLDLTSIHLNAATINESTLFALIKIAPKLKKLNLNGCRDINWDKFISLLPESLPAIRRFFIPATNVSLENVKDIIKKCPNVKSITLWKETLVTAEEKEELEASYPKIGIN